MSTTVYVARRPCGCLQGFAETGSPGLDKAAGQYVSRWIRDGFPVDRVVLPDGEALSDPTCKEHQTHD